MKMRRTIWVCSMLKCLRTVRERNYCTNYYNVLFNNPVNYHDTMSLNLIAPSPTTNTPQFIMHVNARSLFRNIQNLITELSLLSNLPSIIAISETWADTDHDNLPIPGYNYILKARKIGLE